MSQKSVSVAHRTFLKSTADVAPLPFVRGKLCWMLAEENSKSAGAGGQSGIPGGTAHKPCRGSRPARSTGAVDTRIKDSS